MSENPRDVQEDVSIKETLEELNEQVVVEEETDTALMDQFLGRSYVVEKEMIENVDKLYRKLSKLGDDANTVDIINWLNGPSGANYQIPDSDFEMTKYRWIKDIKEHEGENINLNILVGIRGDDDASGDTNQPIFYNVENQMFWMFEANGFKRGLSGIYINAEPILDGEKIKTVDKDDYKVYVFKWNANVADVAAKIGSGVAGGLGNALGAVPDIIKNMILMRGGRRRKMRKTKKLRKSKGGKKKSKKSNKSKKLRKSKKSRKSYKKRKSHKKLKR